ncbi:MAG: UbiA family prenyltransferase [Gemmatimonadaceae bacterium]
MSSADAWLSLVRWRNALLAAAGVLAGAWWSGGRVDARVVLVALAAVAFTAVANTVNDIHDIEIDRVAHPHRALPSGAVGRAPARRFAIASTVIGVGLLAFVDRWLAFVTLPVVALMWTYSTHFKRRGLPGNLVVAALGSLPFLYGGWVVGNPRAGALLLMMAAPLHFAREVAKDVDDAAGDAAARRTLPVTRGVRTARIAVLAGVAAYGLAVALIALAYPLFAALLLPTIFLAALATRRLYLSRDGSARLLKAAMALAIAALIVSGR